VPSACIEKISKPPSWMRLSIDDVDDPVVAAGLLAFRVARAQAFGERATRPRVGPSGIGMCER
jgi:hypothetical protein